MIIEKKVVGAAQPATRPVLHVSIVCSVAAQYSMCGQSASR